MRTSRSTHAFSLIEVVIASAIFAASIFAVIGLMAPMSRRVEDVIDSEVAARLTGSIDGELRRLGFAAVSAPGFLSAMDPSLSNPQPLTLVADQTGSRVLLDCDDPTYPANNRLDDASLPGIANRDRYFQIRLNLVEPFDSVNSPAVFVRADVLWPYYVPIGPAGTTSVEVDDDPHEVVPIGQRQTMSYFFAIRR